MQRALVATKKILERKQKQTRHLAASPARKLIYTTMKMFVSDTTDEKALVEKKQKLEKILLSLVKTFEVSFN